MANSASKSTSASRMTMPEAGAPQESTQDLATDVAKLREDMARLANEIAALSRQSVDTAMRAASERVDQLRAQGEVGMEGLRENYRDVEEQLTQSVREKPMTSLAIAAGIGFLFALITRR